MRADAARELSRIRLPRRREQSAGSVDEAVGLCREDVRPDARHANRPVPKVVKLQTQSCSSPPARRSKSAICTSPMLLDRVTSSAPAHHGQHRGRHGHRGSRRERIRRRSCKRDPIASRRSACNAVSRRARLPPSRSASRATCCNRAGVKARQLRCSITLGRARL